MHEIPGMGWGVERRIWEKGLIEKRAGEGAEGAAWVLGKVSAVV